MRFNELIESIFKPEKKVDRKPLSKSKQKLKKDAMDLDSLFNGKWLDLFDLTISLKTKDVSKIMMNR